MRDQELMPWWQVAFAVLVLVGCLVGGVMMLADASDCARAGGTWINDRGLHGSVCIKDGKVIEP